MALPSSFPAAQGLYNPANEHDACGVAMVATLNKIATHEIVAQALTALRNLEHRGAAGAEPDSGDGAGILIRVPDASDLPQKEVMQLVSHLSNQDLIQPLSLNLLLRKKDLSLSVGAIFLLIQSPLVKLRNQ
jgi:hypothetical protein